MQQQSRPFYPQLAYIPNINRQIWQPRQNINNFGQPRKNTNNFEQPLNQYLPFRPPKPQLRPIPMDVDESMHSRRVNYMNRPVQNQNNFQGKRPPPPDTHPRKNFNAHSI